MSYLPFPVIFHPQVLKHFSKWNYTAQKLLTLPPCGSADRPPKIWKTVCWMLAAACAAADDAGPCCTGG